MKAFLHTQGEGAQTAAISSGQRGGSVCSWLYVSQFKVIKKLKSVSLLSKLSSLLAIVKLDSRSENTNNKRNLPFEIISIR